MDGGGAATGNDEPGFHLGSRLNAGMMAAQGGYNKLMDEENRVSDMGKAADHFRNSMGDDAETHSRIPDVKWKNLSARDKADWFQGYQDTLAAQRVQQQMDDARARTKIMQDNQAEHEAEAGGLSRWAQGMDTTMNTPAALANDDTASVMKQFSPLQKMNLHALATMGASNPHMAAPMLKQLFENFNGEGNTPKVTQLDAGDHMIPFVSWGKNAGQIDPGYAAGLRQTNAKDLLDYKAETQPAKGDVTPQDQFKELASLHREYVKHRDVAEALNKPDAVTAWQAKADEVAQQMTALMPAKKTKAGKAAAATPAAVVGKPAPGDIKYLQANPDKAALFEARFGKGSADDYLP